MGIRNNPAAYFAIYALIAGIFAAMSFSGLFFLDEVTGRLIFGFTWTFVSMAWIGFYVQARKQKAAGMTPDG